MKLRHRIIISALLPVAIIMVIAIALSNSQMNTFVMNEAYTGMEATAIAVRQVFDNNGNGPYHVVDGELWKADFINISRCNHIVDNIKNNTGYEVTVFFGDTRMLTSLQDAEGNRQVGTQCSPEVYQAVVENGETYTSDNVDIFGTRYIVLYIPLYQTASKTPVGMIFLGQPYTNVSANINKASLQTFVVMLVVALIAVVVILLIANSIVKPIFKTSGYLQEMGGGSIGFKIDDDLLSRKDEIGTMVREVDSLNNSLLGIVGAIKEQVDVLQTTFDDCNRNTQRAMEETEQIDETVSGLSIANTTLAGDAMAAGDSVDTISQIIENTNNQVDTFKETADTMEQAAKSAKSTLNELNSSMNEVMAAVQEVSGKTAETHESVSQIASMVNVISEIASQTNLLSLNASIEAARAGEAGRGFAVVASEIQGLADQSDKSAKEIQTVLNQLVTNSNLSVATMNKMQVMIDTQKDKIAQTNDAFDGVDSGIAQTVLGIDNIVEQMTKLDGARNATSATVQNVASIAQENAASAEETASNMNEIASHITSITEKIKQLGDVASTLSNNVGAFKLDN